MDKIKPINYPELRDRCEATIAEYRHRDIVASGFRAFLEKVTRLPRVDKKVVSLLAAELTERGIQQDQYILRYHKTDDFLGDPIYKVRIMWRDTSPGSTRTFLPSEDELSWGLSNPAMYIENAMRGYTLYGAHADKLESLLPQLEDMCRVFNRALQDMQSVAMLTLDGIYPVHPVSSAFRYYDVMP